MQMIQSAICGGTGGSAWEVTCPEGKKIIGFHIAKNSNYVEWLKPIYDDGSEGPEHGQMLSSTKETFKLNSGEDFKYIATMKSSYIDAIQFVTTQRTSKWYGGLGGTVYNFALNGGDLVGYKGRSGAWLDQIVWIASTEKIGGYAKSASAQELFALEMEEWMTKNPYGDVCVAFKDSKFQVNSMILSQAPKLQKIVKDKILFVKESEEVGMKVLLKYLHSGRVLIDDTNYMELLEVSDTYGVDAVKNACFDFIISGKCTVNSVCELLMHTKSGKFSSFGTEDLKQRCLDFISQHTSKVCMSTDFANLDYEFVEGLLKKEEMEVEEVKLFRAIVTWGKKRQDLNPEKTLNQHLADLLPYIRFSSMDGKDLVKVVKPTGLIDKKMYLKILEMQTAPDGYVISDPLPDPKPRGAETWVWDWKTGNNASLWQLSDGNRTIKKISGGSTWANAQIYGSKKLTQGIHYWEVKVNSVNSDKSGTAFGICKDPKNLNQYSADMVIGLSGYQYQLQGSNSQNVNNGDRVGILLHFPKKKVYFFYNGVQMQVTGDLIAKQAYYPCIHVYYANDSFTVSFPTKKPVPK